MASWREGRRQIDMWPSRVMPATTVPDWDVFTRASFSPEREGMVLPVAREIWLIP